MKTICKLTALWCLCLMAETQVHGQDTVTTLTKDSLTLTEIISEVIRNYPSVKKAELDIEKANAKIGLAKSAYYPDISLSSSFTHIGPTSSITIPDMGTFNLFPADNYSAALNYNQTLYDFGKTAKNILFENQNKEVAQSSVEQIRQQLSLSLVNNYYTIVYLQEAILIKNEALATLNEHLRFVEKKAATGSATQYEILTTRVRISAIENQKTDLETSLLVQQSLLASFLGRSGNTSITVKKDLQAPGEIESGDSLIDFALSHRDELKIARQIMALTEARSEMVKSQNNPVVNAFASGGLKNGYLPNMKMAKANYTVGVGFKVPIYDATRSRYDLLQVEANKRINNQDTELARRKIVNEVIECCANAEASLKKVTRSKLQLQEAQQAYILAQTSFQAGVIINLDLLDSSTSVSESRLSLLKTKIDYTVSLLRLKIALGERMY